jgi:UDP-N-acetylmuramoylalanine--D-glutamate ligase
VLTAFRLDAHRIELIRIEDGVSWVDDSKATNPHAADASLRAFRSVVWVAGGLLKGVEVEELVKGHADHLRAAVLIGVDREQLRDALQRHAPDLPVFEVEADAPAEVMRAAVRFAADAAKPGDTVLLAPAAASMDQFTDYAERGRHFQQAVNELLGDDTDD